MNPSAASGLPETASPWTCPFCPLLCDRFQVRPDGSEGLALFGSDCSVARSALAALVPLHADAAVPVARIDGQISTLDAAIDAAATRLAASRQPLIGGLGTDVAGARALQALARTTGAVADAAAGQALMQTLRALQDRGGFTTTLAEVTERADLLVFVGSWAPLRAPELLPRFLGGRVGAAPAIVALGVDAPAAEVRVDDTVIPVATAAGAGDLFGPIAVLCALVAGRAVRDPDPRLAALAEQLKAARYAVLVWEPAQLGPHGALLIERLQTVIGLLNLRTRAAGFPIGGGDGAATANQVFTWLSGLPLRSRLGPLGAEHDPLRFDASRLLSRGEVDALLWVSSFRVADVPECAGPRVVLGPLALGACLGNEANTVFIPVATPGIGTDGHLFRADGVVMLPLHAMTDQGLPSIDSVVRRIQSTLETRRGEPPGASPGTATAAGAATKAVTA
jgi:formylmethanofuran dehydrogenase subunit B